MAADEKKVRELLAGRGSSLAEPGPVVRRFSQRRREDRALEVLRPLRTGMPAVEGNRSTRIDGLPEG